MRAALVSRFAVFDVLFHALLAVDAADSLATVYKYDVGTNYSHFGALLGNVAPWTQPPMLAAAHLLVATTAARVALGAATLLDRVLLLFALAFAVFCSMLDMFQHHVLLVLFAALFLAVHAGAALAPPRGKAARGDSWAQPDVQRWPFIIQVALVYAWATVPKLEEDAWMSGDYFRSLMTPYIQDAVGAESPLWAAIAWLTILTEAILAVCLLVPRLHGLIFLVGPAMHVFMDRAELQIEWFSYYMAFFYVLVIPKSLWDATLGRIAAQIAAAYGRVSDGVRLVVPLTRIAAALAAAVATAAIVHAMPLVLDEDMRPHLLVFAEISVVLAACSAVKAERAMGGAARAVAAAAVVAYVLPVRTSLVQNFLAQGIGASRGGRPADATVAFARSIELDGEHAPALASMAMHQVQALQDLAQGVVFAKRAVAIDADNMMARAALLRTCTQQYPDPVWTTEKDVETWHMAKDECQKLEAAVEDECSELTQQSCHAFACYERQQLCRFGLQLAKSFREKLRAVKAAEDMLAGKGRAPIDQT